MTRTSKPVRSIGRSGSPRRRGAGNIVIGIFIGLIVGLALAVAVAYWLMKNNATLPIMPAAKDTHEVPHTAKSDTPDKPRFDFYKILPGVEEPKVRPETKAPEKSDRAVVEQSRDKAAPDKSTAQKATSSPATAPADRNADKTADIAVAKAPSDKAPDVAKPGDKFWLQAGSFGASSDAENLKARLALDGLEAVVQEGKVPDKGTRYRVRLGPYDNTDELNRMKSELVKRGFEVAVIKN